jgi:small-conductance mechanosensitive channel
VDETLAIKDQLIKAFQDLIQSIINGAPKVVTGIVLFLAALLLAKLVERISRALFKRLHIDALPEKLGLEASLKRIGINQPPSILLPRVIYFLLLFLFARAGSDALGLTAVSDALGAFLGYVPSMLAAVLIVLLGSVVGQFAGGAISRSAEGSGLDFGPALGNVVSGLIFFVSVIMALGQLKIDTDIIRIVTVCCLSAAALAFGLSFGLGTRETTKNIIAGFYARKIFRTGEPMEIRGEKGTLKAIGTTQTLIDCDGRTVSVANSVFYTDIVKQ